MPIGVVNANQVESNKCVVNVFKQSSTFLCIFRLEARLEGSWCSQKALGHAHRRRQRQPGRVQQVGS